jgi:hypothetical protein
MGQYTDMQSAVETAATINHAPMDRQNADSEVTLNVE